MIIELYASTWLTGGKWRWRTRCARNGNILSRSSEGYHNKQDCKAMILRHFGVLAYITEVAR
jgi:uncharacterized protein YegP (UPF0339 family)